LRKIAILGQPPGEKSQLCEGGCFMVSIEDLKKISVLDNLTQPMLENMRALAQLNLFGERHVIFEEGQDADYFYMLLKGKN